MPLHLREAIGCSMRLLPLARGSATASHNLARNGTVHHFDATAETNLQSSMMFLLDSYSSCSVALQPPLHREERHRLLALILFEMQPQAATIELGPSGRLRPEDLHAPTGPTLSSFLATAD